MFVQFLLGAIIPDVPDEVEIQLARSQFIRSKIIDRIVDDDYGIKDLLEEDEAPRQEVRQSMHISEPAANGCCKNIRVLKGKKVKKFKNAEKLAEIPVTLYPSNALAEISLLDKSSLDVLGKAYNAPKPVGKSSAELPVASNPLKKDI